jgi:hypothetical protein
MNSRRLMGLTPKAKDHGTKYSSVLERFRAVRRSKTPRSCPDRDIAVGLSSAMWRHSGTSRPSLTLVVARP